MKPGWYYAIAKNDGIMVVAEAPAPDDEFWNTVESVRSNPNWEEVSVLQCISVKLPATVKEPA